MDSYEYLVVNFQRRFIVTAVATQGRRAAREYVTLYGLQYSDNGQNWFYYTDENKIIMVSVERDLLLDSTRLAPGALAIKLQVCS